MTTTASADGPPNRYALCICLDAVVIADDGRRVGHRDTSGNVAGWVERVVSGELSRVLSWEEDLAEARARLAALDESRDVASALTAAERWRWADPFSGFFLPLPPLARELFSAQGEWRDRDDRRDGRADAVAVDGRGRPVAHVLDRGTEFERANHLWWWEADGSFLEIELMGSGPHVRRARVLDGRLAHVTTATWGDQSELLVLSWREGQPVRADVARVSPHGGWAQARVAEWAADGRLARIRSVSDRGPDELLACLEHAAGLVPTRMSWDARVDQPEPWPGFEAALARAEPLAIALDAALRAAAADVAVAEPFLLEVFARPDPDPLFPPRGRLIGAQWRDRMRRSSSHDGAALFDSYKAAEAGIAVHLELVDRLDDDALRTCRMLSTAYRPGAPWSLMSAADPVADAVGDRLAALLNAEPITGATDPFLATVFIGARYGSEDRYARTRAAVGEQRFARFLESLASTKPRGGAARKLRQQAKRAIQDRDELETLLRDGGLSAHAARLAHEIAEPGLLLLPASAEPARSRLGGPPLLPADEQWPGRLTFLAGIDLTELPASRLPSEGWLLFFVDLGTGEADGLVDEARNEPGSVARLFWTEEPVATTGPALESQPVIARPFLTLPDEWTASQRLGLDVYERQIYEELAQRLTDALPAGDTRHWLGGHATGAQGVPLDDDTLLLLSMDDDAQLGFSFLDAGTVQFRIAPDALEGRDFSRAIALADSC